MDKIKDYRILYELNMFRQRLDFAITTTENQLAVAQKRLKSLKYDLFQYIILLIFPPVVWYILQLITVNPSLSLVYFVLKCAGVIIGLTYLFFLPSLIYYTIQTIMFIRINKEAYIVPQMPLPEGVRKGEKPPEEPTFRSEYDKLSIVLTRYYLYKDKLVQLDQDLKKSSCESDYDKLHAELEKMPLYEDIKPTNIYKGIMQKNVKKKTLYIIGAIILSVVISLGISVSGSF